LTASQVAVLVDHPAPSAPDCPRSQELRWRVSDLLDALGPDLQHERLEEFARAVAAARTAFIDGAKRCLALPR
jgi:hypothetical protein